MQDNKEKLADMPCQSCGKLVKVILPFYGCVFCRDCIKPVVYTIEGRKKVKKDEDKR